jgi:hypothetical protein
MVFGLLNPLDGDAEVLFTSTLLKRTLEKRQVAPILSPEN